LHLPSAAHAQFKSTAVKTAASTEQLQQQLLLQAAAGTATGTGTSVSNRRHQNVALMGQFNFNATPDDVVHWMQKWRRFFDTIVVRGPFDEA
jgi:hypothetical protein